MSLVQAFMAIAAVVVIRLLGEIVEALEEVPGEVKLECYSVVESDELPRIVMEVES